MGDARYAGVMSIKRITISVPSGVASRIKKAAGSVPVSAWVTDIVEGHLDEAELERQWQSFYRAVNPSKTDTRRAEAIHRRLTKRSGRREAA